MLKTLQPFKTPGTDDIYPAILDEGMDQLIPHMVRFFRTSLAHRVISSMTSMMVFIPKSGRSSYMVATCYRSISLTLFLLETLEECIDMHIKDTVLPLNPNGHAHQKGKSLHRLALIECHDLACYHL